MGNTLVDQDGSCRDKKSSKSIVSFLILYVNDILLEGNDIPTLQSIETWLNNCLSMKDLREVKTSKQDTIADSTKEVAYNATSEVAKEIVWIKKFIYELSVITSIADAIELRCDNNGAFAETKEPKISSKIQTYS
ncbi:hypothetical protein V6N12_010470 [Hibiscus sabdariffa]|uniref:Reverse transcriptase Ty1/copia-type domain-containing protein n=1 Tax=Hibiscus sabdariffa TaxID=183260 RepID=A0ABR2EK69_9ROSI